MLLFAKCAIVITFSLVLKIAFLILCWFVDEKIYYKLTNNEIAYNVTNFLWDIFTVFFAVLIL